MRKIEQISKNRKDYIIKGNSKTSCDTFFDKYLLPTRNKNYFQVSIPLENKILKKAFKPEDINIGSIDEINNIFGFELIFHGKNKYNVDVIFGRLFPSPRTKKFLDFIPFYIILHCIPLETFHGWYKSNYIPGQEIGIYIPTEYNMVWEDGSAILNTNKEWAKIKEIILYEYFGKIWDNIVQNYIQDFKDIEDMNEDEAEIYDYALNTSFELLTGQKIPEIECNLAKVVLKSINKIGI